MIAPWGEERKLLTAIRGGDRGAAEEIVERTYSAVFASLYRLCGDHDLAADLTQETYQKAWAALPNFDGSTFETYASLGAPPIRPVALVQVAPASFET